LVAQRFVLSGSGLLFGRRVRTRSLGCSLRGAGTAAEKQHTKKCEADHVPSATSEFHKIRSFLWNRVCAGGNRQPGKVYWNPWSLWGCNSRRLSVFTDLIAR